MLFPNEKIIYEVPIYSMPEKEFKRRWDNWKKKWYDRSEQLWLYTRKNRGNCQDDNGNTVSKECLEV